jgi:hypothetical protein
MNKRDSLYIGLIRYSKFVAYNLKSPAIAMFKISDIQTVFYIIYIDVLIICLNTNPHKFRTNDWLVGEGDNPQIES